MQRGHFLLSLLALCQAKLFAGAAAVSRVSKGFKVSAGEGRLHGHMRLHGVNANILDLKISGADNDGGLAIFEQTSLSPGRGTPMHVHFSQDEMFHVLEGNYFFKVGEDTFSMSTGEFIFLPRNVPHGWTQVSEKGKMTVIFQPAGKMEDFFQSVAALQHEPSAEEMAQLFAASGMKIVGPPVKAEPPAKS